MSSDRPQIWIHDSFQTESYAAVAGGPMLNADQKKLLFDSAAVFQTATDAFEKRLANYPIDTSGIDFAEPVGWHTLGSELVGLYSAAHRDLLMGDEEYLAAIGHVYDEYRRIEHYVPIPRRSEQDRNEVFMREGQELVDHAISEGILTSLAVYQVVPALTQIALSKYPDVSPAEARSQLLSSAQVFSVKMSRHSKAGNDHIIKQLQLDPGSLSDKINYESLTFNPYKFRVLQSAAGRLSIQACTDNRLDADKAIPFNGCPAFENGSVARINRLITNIIKIDEIVERSLG